MHAQPKTESISHQGSESRDHRSDQHMTQTSFAQVDVVSIQMVRDRQLLYNGNRVTAPAQASEAFKTLVGDADREYFMAFMLDNRNRITRMHIVSQGSLNQSIVHPRETFKVAVLSNAASIILAHNHPSGDLTPSPEDLAVTRRLKEASDIMGIRILDHIITNTETGAFMSFVERGLL